MKIKVSRLLIVIVTFIPPIFVVTGLEAKKGGVKPDKPVQTESEWIVFAGDLENVPESEVVEGCWTLNSQSPGRISFF